MNMNEEGATETTFRKVSRLAVMANAVNFIGGVSFPSIPFAVKESGLIGGLLLLSLVAILTEASHRLIAESSKFHYKMRWLDIDSYEALVAVPFGRRGELILKFSVFVVAFGACVEFTIMVKDLIPSLLGDYSSLSPTYMVVVTWALLIVPLTLIKDISTLAYVSGVSLILSALLAAVIIKTAPFGQNVQAHGGLLQVIQDYGFRPHLFTTICIFTEVFAWQHGIFPFLNSLRHPNMKRWRFVTSRVNTLIAIIYLVVSVPAYLGYLDDTAGDIFLNLPSDGSGSTLTNIARYCFLFICIMTYPLEMLVVRDVVKTAWNHPETATITHNHLNDDLFLNGRELLIVLTLDVFALLLGLWLHDLSDACALVGALGGSIVCFIIPGMIYIGVNGDSFIQWTLILTGDEREYGYYDMAEVLHSKASKPWWFYVLGFPLWCYIAHVGKTGVDNKLTESSNIQSSGMFASFDDNSIVSNSSFISSVPSQDDSVISNSFFSCIDYTEGMCGTQRGRRASKIKFVVSICLIVFGLVNLVIGLVERFE